MKKEQKILPEKKTTPTTFEVLNFLGRPDIDTGDGSDSEQQHQREGKPYHQRIFHPTEAQIFNERIETKKFFAGGNVDDAQTPFFQVFLDETLLEGSRKRVMRVMKDGDSGAVLEVHDDGSVLINGVNVEQRLAAIEERLTAGGL